MMPLAKLNTTAVTMSQPPHISTLARNRSVRGAARVTHSPPTSATSAAGSNQLIWLPISLPNSRPRPVWPDENPPVPPPGLPLLLVPSSRPIPL